MSRTLKRLFPVLALPCLLIGAPVATAQQAAPPNAALLARGEYLARAGDCVACHTDRDGKTFAGGLPMKTPFGTIYTSNITPDPQTGIGTWTSDQFYQMMHSGRFPDGGLVYPAMPFGSYTKVTREDSDAIYAYLRSIPPVKQPNRPHDLRFPYNNRSLILGWRTLFFDEGAYKPDPTKSADWNRGAYLVEGLGHCGACHSPRNALGAEKDNAYLAGGFAEAWEAPALTSLSQAPIPWSEDELFIYLRTGESRFHGVAAGPMAPVVKEMASLPDQDIRAMTIYLGSFNAKALDRPAQDALATKLEAETKFAVASSPGARLYQGACAVCHEVNGLPLFGSRPSLALNSNLYSARPDNLIQVILHGIAVPAASDLGYMPAFRDSLDDDQVAALVDYLRGQFAPDKPQWPDIRATISRVRAGLN